MICHGCMSDKNDASFLLPEIKYAFCSDCSCDVAVNRKGDEFRIGEGVFLDKFHLKTEGRVFVIRGIYSVANCESGKMIFLIDKETQRPLKSMLDTNWLLKNITT
jgi:hypothetical protein